jgi:hypothetical protein
MEARDQRLGKPSVEWSPILSTKRGRAGDVHRTLRSFNVSSSRRGDVSLMYRVRNFVAGWKGGGGADQEPDQEGPNSPQEETPEDGRWRVESQWGRSMGDQDCHSPGPLLCW